MASFPPKKNTTHAFEASLVDSTDRPEFKANPTLAAGDILVYKDGASGANIATLPTAIDSGRVLTFSLSAAEMNADRVFIECRDVAGGEWDAVSFLIETSSQQIADLATATAVTNAIATNTYTINSNNPDFDYVSGDEMPINFDVYDQDNVTATDLSAATAIAWGIYDDSGVALLAKTLAGGGLSVTTGDDNSTQNRVVVTMANADTSSLEGGRKYRHSLQVIDASSRRFTPIQAAEITIFEDLITS